ncbi:MAG: PilT/PilU family type 4a pilus ATPase [bacterium]
MTETKAVENQNVELDLMELIRIAYENKASDLFIKEDNTPIMRQHGKVFPLPGEYPILDYRMCRDLCYSVMSHEQVNRFEHKHEMDLAFSVEGACRVRANIYSQRVSTAGCFRMIPLRHYTLDELGMPPVLAEMCKNRQGLILITGPTGCGKSTTLAAMIDIINQKRRCHIVTIEDPIEFVHMDNHAIVSQREVGIDTDNFLVALKAVVRESPDVILIGEMRDPETMHAALQAAETGHLVFSTVHTPSAAETLDRVINMFPPEEKKHITERMAGSLRAVVAQKLVPRIDGRGRAAAVEIMVVTPTISKLIEDGHFGEIYHAISEGSFWGMQTMNQCLLKYVRAGIISEEEAFNFAGVLSELRQLLRH